MVEVIGAGFGRTSTLSLKLALEQLGYTKCYHMLEVRHNPGHREQWRTLARGGQVDWSDLLSGYRATCDWPSCNFWREQLEAYPDARVLLTERDPEAWHRSVMNTIYAHSSEARKSDDPDDRAGAEWAFELIWDGVFNGRVEEKDYAIDRFLRHNAAVKAEVPADRLLVYEPGQGWEPICDFLGCPVPDAPYPKVNSTEEFQQRRAAPPAE